MNLELQTLLDSQNHVCCCHSLNQILEASTFYMWHAPLTWIILLFHANTFIVFVANCHTIMGDSLM